MNIFQNFFLRNTINVKQFLFKSGPEMNLFSTLQFDFNP